MDCHIYSGPSKKPLSMLRRICLCRNKVSNATTNSSPEHVQIDYRIPICLQFFKHPRHEACQHIPRMLESIGHWPCVLEIHCILCARIADHTRGFLFGGIQFYIEAMSKHARIIMGIAGTCATVDSRHLTFGYWAFCSLAWLLVQQEIYTRIRVRALGCISIPTRRSQPTFST